MNISLGRMLYRIVIITCGYCGKVYQMICDILLVGASLDLINAGIDEMDHVAN